ncbi:MAG: ABC transporter permease [Lachnospiraceae bacterium]|nr:ABC transporter permease [Lachnospiraceae bacterium]
MNKVLSRRFPRQVRADLFRYSSLFLMIALCMYIVIALVDAAEIVIQGTENNQVASNLEDGQVTVFTKLTDEQLKEISDTGVTIEPHISYDATLDDGSVLRIFVNRTLVDKVTLDEGRFAEDDNEIVLEKRYCEEHDIHSGDVIKIGNEDVTVTGIGSAVDYDASYRKLTDTAVESRIFGLGFVTEHGYEHLRQICKTGSEDLTYAFVLNGAMSSDDLKQIIQTFDFDYKEVDDPYYREMLNDTYGKRDEITDGINDLVDGVDELYDGAEELKDGTAELADGMGDLYDGSKELYDGTEKAIQYMPEMLQGGLKGLKNGTGELKDGIKEAYDGSVELDDGAGELLDGVSEIKDGVKDLKKQSNEMLDEIFSKSPDNITSFLLRGDNMRIGGAAGDIEINKMIGVVAGVIVIVLFTYVLSVFVIHQIQEESSVIGALYALGVKKKDLMRHYIFIPTAISFLGGLTGAAFGLSGLGSSWQTSDSYSYYSIPWFDKVVPAYLIVYAVVMPPVVSVIVNYLVIRKSLSRTALSLIKNEQKASKGKDIKLPNMPFMRKFKIRQMLRERRTAVTVVAGMLISLLIFMMGMDCYVLCKSVGELSVKDTRYNYMYNYKYPTDEPPAGGEPCYVTSLKRERLGYSLDVTVMGIDDDNPYIDVKPIKGKNKIVASDAVCARYGVGKGDKIILTDNASDIDYAFTIAEVVPYSVGLTVFMDIESMRELFGEDEDYYNVVLSDSSLDIEEGRLYSVTKKEDVERSSGIFSDLMAPMVTMLMTMSIIIFCIVMYLMTSVMIERASFGISLLKIFGFNGREVKELYLDGNRMVIMIGALIGIPVAKMIIDRLFPVFISNVACCMHLEYKWYHYVMIYAAIVLFYSLISMILTSKLNKVTPAEVLKNRE